MEGLILRFDAPLISFGGVKVDQNNETDQFPGLSMFAGLIANAMGWSHADMDRLQALQSRLIAASRWDVEPEYFLDYQTVDLGQPKMREKGWTTSGVPEHREGGPAAKFGTHQRYRHYLAGGVLTSVLALVDDEFPGLVDIQNSLTKPARPLFIGRKCCLPSIPIFQGRVEGKNILDMLIKVPRAKGENEKTKKRMLARWPVGLDSDIPEQIKRVYDLRDWKTQLHSSSRMVAEGFIEEAAPCS